MTGFSVEVTSEGLRAAVGSANLYRNILSEVADATDSRSGYVLHGGSDMALIELFHVAGLVEARASEGSDDSISMFILITAAGRDALSSWSQ
jgi:hypothetical protein